MSKLFQPVETKPTMILVYGEEKVGKTHFAMTSPGPHYLIGTEAGHETHTARQLDPNTLAITIGSPNFERPSTNWFSAYTGLWTKFEDAAFELVKMPRGTVIIDSGSDILGMAVAQLNIDWSRGDKAMPPMMYGPLYGMLKDMVYIIRDKHDVVMTARKKPIYDDDTGKATGESALNLWRDGKYFADILVDLDKPFPAPDRTRRGFIEGNHLEGTFVLNPTWDRVVYGDREELSNEYLEYHLPIQIRKAHGFLKEKGIEFDATIPATVDEMQERLQELRDLFNKK